MTAAYLVQSVVYLILGVSAGDVAVTTLMRRRRTIKSRR